MILGTMGCRYRGNAAIGGGREQKTPSSRNCPARGRPSARLAAPRRLMLVYQFLHFGPVKSGRWTGRRPVLGERDVTTLSAPKLPPSLCLLDPGSSSSALPPSGPFTIAEAPPGGHTIPAHRLTQCTSPPSENPWPDSKAHIYTSSCLSNSLRSLDTWTPSSGKMPPQLTRLAPPLPRQRRRGGAARGQLGAGLGGRRPACTA